jgi:chromosome partition protein MukE
MAATAQDHYDMTRHALFPRVDQLFRRGGNVGGDDLDAHEFVREAEAPLREFYQAYGCELVKTPEDVYYLSVQEETLFSTRRLSRLEMIVGKTLALMYLDPQTHSNLGRVALETVLGTLDLNPGRDAVLMHAQIRSPDEEVANKKLRDEVRKALSRLGRLNFIQWDAYGDEIIPHKALLRFAEDVRTAAPAEQNLEALIRMGTVELGYSDAAPTQDGDDDDEA